MPEHTLSHLFQLFLRERRYIKNSAENTIYYYERCYRTYTRMVGETLPTKVVLDDFVIKMREAGIKPSTCNVYIRGWKSFLTWLHENEYTEKLPLKLLKCEQPVMKTFSDVQLRTIINYKPINKVEERLWAILMTLMDTGCRIDEVLTLRQDKLDFENMLMTVLGKGSKERIIPMSLHLRKILYNRVKNSEFDLVFCTRDGSKLMYDNIRRDFSELMAKLGIDGFDGAFHAFRRSFARNYVRNGGNLFYLMKQLGHTSLEMSKRYCEVDENDLALVHKKTSTLNRLK